ncbi:MAG: cytochrome c biogenesis protein CcsA [candidate division Zixibacteria bacterium]|nr:cytochrome c biogenesis protein CcsA [candidate division Zixibacteria bacterium]MCI0597012.1 cytochrome c biogenesis protein CcsA [candidate division Zixibacteria bacterium]
MSVSLVGNLFLGAALTFCALSIASYLYAWGPAKGTLVWGRRFYWASALFSVGTLVYLFYLFVTKHYEITYVAEYSSSDLPFHYLFASVWAGQQGSFLLWLGWSAVLGLFMQKRLGEYEERGMFFYLLVQFFLLFILVKRSPFALSAITPDDGRGLNPLLQDYWMVIHPPVMFLGFAAMAIPFALAMAALTRREYRNWVTTAFPWVNFGRMVLGTAIIMGGFWAYKVLGWGGYWGWDPVENASLMPFLGGLALTHGFLIQKNKGSLPKTNFFLAITAFLLVVYGTFLTRSGVLADFSVHSFVDLGINAFLVLFLFTFIIVGYGMLLWRAREIKGPVYSGPVVNQDFSVLLMILFISLSAFMVLLGTSSPLITRLFGQPSNVEISYYVKTHLPIGIAIAFLIGLSPYLFWRSATPYEKLKKALWPALLALVCAVLTFVAGFREGIYPLFHFLTFFALFSNVAIFFRSAASRPVNSGGHLSHVGVSMLLAGFIFSSVYSQEKRLNLALGEKGEAFGYTLTYKGTEGDLKQPENALIFAVEHKGEKTEARPRFFWAEYNQGYMRKPAIQKGIMYDLYISPINHSRASDTQSEPGMLVFGDNETKEDAFGYKITFKGFTEPKMNPAEGEVSIAALLEVAGYGAHGVRKPVLTIKNSGERLSEPVELSNGNTVALIDARPDPRQVALKFAGPAVVPATATEDLVSIEVSKKPFIIFVWFGTMLVTLGGIISVIRRSKELPPSKLSIDLAKRAASEQPKVLVAK